MSSEPSGDRLPFEPKKVRPKNTAKPAPESGNQHNSSTPESSAIPQAIAQRMIQRMVLFCGIPTVLGMSTFITSYIIVSQGWFKVPNIAVVFVSMGFFGLGVFGLTYGVLSASWDEEIPGSPLGWSEFTENWKRVTSAWRSKKPLKTED